MKSYPIEWKSWNRDQRRAYMQQLIDAPCPVPVHGTHSDPDTYGICILCGCMLDILDEDLNDEGA